MAFDIIVLNIKDPLPQGYWGVTIMRPFPLSNPFYLKDIHDDEQRADSLAKFKTHLWRQMQNPESVEMKSLILLAQTANDIALVCCCAPKPCHGNIVKAAVEYIRNNRNLIPAKWAPMVGHRKVNWDLAKINR